MPYRELVTLVIATLCCREIVDFEMLAFSTADGLLKYTESVQQTGVR